MHTSQRRTDVQEDQSCKGHWTKDDLQQAIDCHQFVPFFQPKQDLQSGLITSVEVLARWRHPQIGVLSPCHFVDLMERENLISRLTESMFRQALDTLQRCFNIGRRLGIAINVSPTTLVERDGAEKIASLVATSGICPTYITVEVTESIAIPDCSTLLRSLTTLRNEGFQVSIDDFGTRYSSLQLLHQMPFTELKIDKSFIVDRARDSKSISILKSIVQLARNLKISTVAEGIENEQDLELAMSSGCRTGQGFFIGMPMSPANLFEYLYRHPIQEQVHGLVVQ
jgi:EAL domain-containing protein (putative c-di-GMP-specific phosphodiesterase class I)